MLCSSIEFDGAAHRFMRWVPFDRPPCPSGLRAAGSLRSVPSVEGRRSGVACGRRQVAGATGEQQQ